MAKFCTNCGKPLEEGKACSCKKEVNLKEVKETTKEIKAEIKEKMNDIKSNPAVKRVLELAKGLFTKPIDAIQTFSKDENLVLGIIFIAISSILTGLFITIFMNESTSNLGGMIGGGFSGLIEFPFFKIFASTAIGILVISFAIPFLYDVFVGKIFKATSTWKKMLACCGAVSLFISMLMLIGIIALFISIQFGLVIILIGSCYTSILLINSIKELTKIDKNKYVYTYTIVMTISFIMIWILSKIMF